MNRVKLFFWVLMVGSFAYTSYGQNQESANVKLPASPTVAGLARYADTSVGSYSGIPSISIPIFSISTKEISLPISLSYHAGGIKVSQEASWVGLGWSLNAGGIITQQERGYNDLYPKGLIRSYIDNYGDYDKIHSIGFFNCENVVNWPWWWNWGYCGNFPNDANNWALTYLNKPFNAATHFYKDMFFEQPISDGTITTQLSDVEPDLFLYNFGNYSGKFILQSDGDSNNIKALLLDNSTKLDVKVIKNDKQILFKVTDPNGLVYVFEKTNTSMNTDNYEEYITSWLLTKIIAPNKEEVKIEYEKDEPYIESTRTPSEVIDYTYGIGSTSSKWLESGISKYGLNTYKKHTTIMRSTIVADSYLPKRISWPSGQIDFTTSYRDDYGSGSAKKLSEITVSNLDKDVVKKYKLNYSYFNQNTTSTGYNKNKRLKLISFDEVNSKKSIEKGISHKFSYNERKGLPSKETNSYDHWGYYNGKNNGSRSRIPEIITFSGDKKSNYNGSDRTPDFDYAIEGVLKEIEYPSGGKVTYEFELNDFFSRSGHVTGSASGSSDLVIKNLSFPIRNYMDYVSPFINKEGDDVGNFPNYRDFEILTTADVVSYEIWFDLNEMFFDHIQSQNLSSFSLNLYKIDENSSEEKLFKAISLDEFINNSDWEGFEGEYYKNFKKVYNEELEPGLYRLRFANFSDNYKINLNYDTYLTGELLINYTGTNFIDDKPKYIHGYKAGGLRIKKISSPKNTRIFTYENGVDEKIRSSGIILSFPKYRISLDRGSLNLLRFHSDSSIPTHGGVEGNIVGYQRIMETYIGRQDENYSIVRNFHVERSAEEIPYAPLFSSNLNNKPMYISLYDSKGVLKKETYYYWENHVIDRVQAMNVYNKHFLTEQPSNLYLNSRYFIPIEFTKLRYKEDTVYGTTESTSPMYESAVYQYSLDNSYNEPLTTHNQVAVTSKAIENGKERITKIYRPEEMLAHVPNLAEDQKNLMQELILSNRTNIPVQTEVYQGKYSAQKLVSKSRTEFKKTKNGLIVPVNQKIAMGKSALEVRVVYHRYDSHANPLEISQKDGPHTVYLYGYTHQYPIAKIENATFSEVARALGVSEAALEGFNENQLGQINGLRAQKPEWMITTYTHIPLVGMETVTDPKGLTNTYEYDDFNRLKYIKDHNGDILEAYEYNYRTE